jgi:hypothetical protein
MPILSYDRATVSHRLQLSKRALVYCCSSLLATLFGAIAIPVSFRLVVDAHAGSSAYWTIVAGLLTVWLASIFNMYRLALREAHDGGDRVRQRYPRIAFSPVLAVVRGPVRFASLRFRR